MSKPESENPKIPPQDIEAERSLLGAILIDSEVLADVVEIIKAKDFYDKNHATIFDAMISLYEKHRPVDMLTLTDELKKEDKLEIIGGSAYLSELTNYVPTASHAEAYADIIAQKAVRRRLIKASTEINEMSYDEKSEVSELLSKAESELFSVSDESLKQDLTSIEDVLTNSFDRIENLYQNKGELRGIKTGYRDLDNMTAGLQRSDLIILAARPAMGKTTLVTNLAYNVAKIENKAVLFFSLEMSKDQLVDRMLADASGVDSWNIRTGNLSDEDFSQITEAMGSMAEAPIYIDDKPGLTVLEMRTKARRIAHERELGLIVVDYLQLMQGSERSRDNRVQEVSEISRSLKLVARELNVPLIALSQLSRSVESRQPPIPQLSDLRESGSIEQDADIVSFIYRPGYYEPDNPDVANITDLIIAKHRNGPVGKVSLYFHPERLRFVSLDKRHE